MKNNTRTWNFRAKEAVLKNSTYLKNEYLLYDNFIAEDIKEVAKVALEVPNYKNCYRLFMSEVRFSFL